MSGPRTKRQFAGAASDPSQRQITSFFAKSSSSADSAPASSKPAALNGPHLPLQVQTGLLTVGMRVRKAIPEGYKTHNTAFQLWADDSSTHTTGPATSSSAFTTSLRELEPFCGLNKVGGLAFQHTSSPDYNDDDAMPDLTSSQDSVASSTISLTPPSRMNITPAPIPSATLQLPTRPRKRVFLPDEDESVHTTLNTPLPHAGPFRLSSRDETWLDDEISPCSLAPPPGLWESARVLAVPRRSPRQQNQGSQVGRKGGFVGMGFGAEVEGGQENVMVVVRVAGGLGDGSDFEEASFLDYGLEGDMEIE
jgi:hypothetical protein